MSGRRSPAQSRPLDRRVSAGRAGYALSSRKLTVGDRNNNSLSHSGGSGQFRPLTAAGEPCEEGMGEGVKGVDWGQGERPDSGGGGGGGAEAGIDALTTAAARGDLARVRELVSAGVDVNARNEFGRTPLQVLKLNRADVAEALLIEGADPNVKETSNYGNGKSNTLFTPAHNAARAGFLDTLKTLVKHGADVTLVDRWGNTPAHWAAKNNHFEIVQYLCRAMRMDTALNISMETPLDYQALQRTRQRKRWIKKQSAVPSALKDLACMRIRKLLGPERLRLYRQLPLPEVDMNFIMLQD